MSLTNISRAAALSTKVRCIYSLYCCCENWVKKGRPRHLRRAGIPRPSLRGRRAVGSGPISPGPRPRSVESRPDPSAPPPLRGFGVHAQVVAYPVTWRADGSCRLHSRSRLPNPSSRNRYAISYSALLGRDHAGVLPVGVRAFRGPFAAVSTPLFLRTFRFCDAFRDLLDSVLFFMIFVSFFHPSRTDVAALPTLPFFSSFGRCPQNSETSL